MQSHGRRDSFIADFRRDIVRDATPGIISVITAIRLSLPSDRTRGGQQQNGLTRRGGDKCGSGAGSRRSSLTTCQRRCSCRCRCHQEDHQRCARRSRVTRIKALSILATSFVTTKPPQLHAWRLITVRLMSNSHRPPDTTRLSRLPVDRRRRDAGQAGSCARPPTRSDVIRYAKCKHAVDCCV